MRTIDSWATHSSLLCMMYIIKEATRLDFFEPTNFVEL